MNNEYEQFKYTRKRWGRGFQYLELPHHERVKCVKTVTKIKLIVIPPMWQKVLISLDHTAKIVAVGRDAKGRKQYIYSESWQLQQQTLKFAKLSAFAQALPKMRTHCRDLLATKDWPLPKVLALMVLVLDETGVRIGNKRYSDENQSYGLSTLRRKHLVLDDDVTDNNQAESVFLEYVGKSGKDRQVNIDDGELASHIKQCSQQPGYNIFRYQQTKSNWQDVCSEDVNEFIKENMGEDFSCKDFRTWTGTCLAVESYWQTLEEKPNTKKKLVNIVIEKVAKQLGNTPAICKDYYIHPLILEGIENGTLGKRIDDGDASNTQLDAVEKFVLRTIQAES